MLVKWCSISTVVAAGMAYSFADVLVCWQTILADWYTAMLVSLFSVLLVHSCTEQRMWSSSLSSGCDGCDGLLVCWSTENWRTSFSVIFMRWFGLLVWSNGPVFSAVLPHRFAGLLVHWYSGWLVGTCTCRYSSFCVLMVWCQHTALLWKELSEPPVRFFLFFLVFSFLFTFFPPPLS